jgi:hypothetical protein
VREYVYRVDGEGRVFHDGSEIVDAATLRFFLRTMRRAPDGRGLVVCAGEQNWFEAGETPYVVQRLRLVGPSGAPDRIDLVFAGDYAEPLDPATLESAGDRIACRVRSGAFAARFGRVATQQLAPLLTDAPTGPALRLGGLTHPVAIR